MVSFILKAIDYKQQCNIYQTLKGGSNTQLFILILEHCCTYFNFISNGEAAVYQLRSMGKFTLLSSFNQKPLYQNNYGHYMYWMNPGRWMVRMVLICN